MGYAVEGHLYHTYRTANWRRCWGLTPSKLSLSRKSHSQDLDRSFGYFIHVIMTYKKPLLVMLYTLKHSGTEGAISVILCMTMHDHPLCSKQYFVNKSFEVI